MTTSRNSLRQGKLGVTPVTMDGEGDVMWITEIEQVTSHYRAAEPMSQAIEAEVVMAMLT